MALREFECKKCKNVQEELTQYIKGKVLCEKCGTETKIKQIGSRPPSFDCPGGYDYEHGKKAWKKHNSVSDQADIIAGTKEPY